MNEIKIMDGWSYAVDDQQYILIREFEYEKRDFKTRQLTGEVGSKREEVGYFRNFYEMLGRVAELTCNEKIARGEITTIQEHLAELRKVYKELKEICDFAGKQ